jgi:predicted pyridoxine 5'-phosphate oxidase superfamily flavin-nucleotide-binding protein
MQMARYDEMMFTPAVQERQDQIGSKGRYDTRYAQPALQVMGPDEIGFLQDRSTIYIATVGETGWPYIQHRGGERGFIKHIEGTTIGFADYPGNRQLISTGNLDGDDRVSLFAMDYARKARLKLQGHAKVLEAKDHPDLTLKLMDNGARAPERLMVIDITAHDWNCPKYIMPRFDAAEVSQLVGPEMSRLEARIAELEAENAALKATNGDNA